MPVFAYRGLSNEGRAVYQASRTQTASSLLSLRGIVQRLTGSTAPKTIVFITEGVVIEKNITDVSWVGDLTAGSQSHYVIANDFTDLKPA